MFDKLASVTPSQWAIAGLIVLAFFALSVWSIFDAWKRDFGSSNEKFAWIQVMIFIPVLGSVAYHLIGKKRGKEIS